MESIFEAGSPAGVLGVYAQSLKGGSKERGLMYSAELGWEWGGCWTRKYVREAGGALDAGEEGRDEDGIEGIMG